MEKYSVYDAINTYAARLLAYHAKEQKKLLGIKNFNYKNIPDKWLLHIMSAYSILKDNEIFYLDCSWFIYIWLRYFKRIKNLRYKNNNSDIFFIKADIFAEEACGLYGKDVSILKEICYNYWGE